mmetsp:Transcript_28245/g.66039  ORF Transcript_28245/g.66039 Transcript_28245/m.66039 type:complete len:240 (+) Transcript_28245:1568-2287(+)
MHAAPQQLIVRAGDATKPYLPRGCLADVDERDGALGVDETLALGVHTFALVRHRDERAVVVRQDHVWQRAHGELVQQLRVGEDNLIQEVSRKCLTARLVVHAYGAALRARRGDASIVGAHFGRERHDKQTSLGAHHHVRRRVPLQVERERDVHRRMGGVSVVDHVKDALLRDHIHEPLQEVVGNLLRGAHAECTLGQGETVGDVSTRDKLHVCWAVASMRDRWYAHLRASRVRFWSATH